MSPPDGCNGLRWLMTAEMAEHRASSALAVAVANGPCPALPSDYQGSRSPGCTGF
jgi:hypothetical protein